METEKGADPSFIGAPTAFDSAAFHEDAKIVLHDPLVDAELSASSANRGKLAGPFTFGVVGSALAHVLVLLWAIGSFASIEGFAEVEVIPVQLVTEEEEEEALELTPPSETETETAPPEPTTPQPSQNNSTDEQSAQPDADPIPPPPEETSADAPSVEADAASASPTSPASPEGAPDTELSDLLESLGFAVSDQPLDQSGESARAIAAQVRRCWEAPAGWSEPRHVSVTVRFLLNRDGTIKGTPAVIEFHASPLGKAAADNAVRAVFECGPYALPPETYEQWQDVQVRLTP